MPSEGRWRARFTDARGVSRMLTARTEQDIIAVLDSDVAQRNSGMLGLSPSKVPTLAEWLVHWLSTKTDMADKGHERHCTDVHQYLIPLLGRVRLDRLDPVMVESAYAHLAAQPSQRRESGLSASSVRRVHATLRSALNDAYRLGVLASPFMDRVRPPKVKAKVIEVLAAEEVDRFLEAAEQEGQSCFLRWSLAVKWGLRQGEALGLQWSDLDLSAGRLEIRRQVQRSSGSGLVVVDPKAGSFRHLVVDDGTLAGLRTLHSASTPAPSAGAVERPWMFPTTTETVKDPRNDQRQFKALLQRAAICEVNVHVLRHTAITRLIEQGVPVPVVKDIVGHSDIRTTMGYVHLANSPAKQIAAQMVTQAYDKSRNGSVVPLRPEALPQVG